MFNGKHVIPNTIISVPIFKIKINCFSSHASVFVFTNLKKQSPQVMSILETTIYCFNVQQNYPNYLQLILEYRLFK